MTHNKNHSETYKSGFTLAELTIVLALLAVIAAIAIPSSAAMEKRYLQSASLQLKSDIQFIQNMEQTTGQDYIIAFPGTNEYRIYCGSVLNKPVKYVTLAGVKSISKNNGLYIEFTANGTTQSGSATIKLYSKNYYQEITTSIGTGHVAISSIKGIFNNGLQ